MHAHRERDSMGRSRDPLKVVSSLVAFRLCEVGVVGFGLGGLQSEGAGCIPSRTTLNTNQGVVNQLPTEPRVT